MSAETEIKKHKKQIIFVSSEAKPYSKQGGLADVTGELSQELANKGYDVLVLSPWFDTVKKKFPGIKEKGHVSIPTASSNQNVDIGYEKRNGDQIVDDNDKTQHYVTYGFIGHPNLKEQALHGPYEDHDAKRYALFAQAVPEVATQLGFQNPDIIHCHDWQAGLLPAILKHSKQLPLGFNRDAKTIFTIHNAAYQGQVDIEDVLQNTNLPTSIRSGLLDDRGYANSMVAGTTFADEVTTVSPTYAKELNRDKLDKYDAGLRHAPEIKGIVNGITNEWDPAKINEYTGQDYTGYQNYSDYDAQAKQHNKALLCEELGLDKERPLLGMVSRIAEGQKGADVLIDSIPKLLEQGWNIAVAGSGNADLMIKLKKLSEEHPERVFYNNAFSESDLTHRIIAGSDAFTIPSEYEPCGLTQLQAMAYGTIPIATRTGGLADTIIDSDNEKEATGYLFEDKPNVNKLVSTAQRAFDDYGTAKWQGRMRNGIARDSSWSKSADDYSTLYSELMAQENTRSSDWKTRRSNNLLRAYNMYPRNYANFTDMKNQVKHIADLGFNAVYFNPLAEVGNSYQPDWTQLEGETLPPEHPQRNRSVYAMDDPNRLNQEFVSDKNASPEEQDEELKALLEEVRSHGMQPMCDVAFSHMAIDSDYTSNRADLYDENGHHVDTKRWFRHYEEGKLKGELVRHGINNAGLINEFDDKGDINPKMVWTDVAQFDYDNPAIRKEIVEYLWKPYVERLADLGFTSMRIDSVAQNNQEVLDEVIAYFKKQVLKRHPHLPKNHIFIFAETLGQHIEQYGNSKELTHAYSSACFQPILHAADENSAKQCKAFWSQQHTHGDNEFSLNAGRIEKEVLHTFKDTGGKRHYKDAMLGGVVGYPSSQDEQSIVNDFVKKGYTIDPEEARENIDLTLINTNNGQLTIDETNEPIDVSTVINVDAAERALREKMAQSMFIANGGLMMFGGDEYIQLGKRTVFNDHRKGYKLGDLTEFVTDINRIASELPSVQKEAWNTRRFTDNDKLNNDLVLIERHNSRGYHGVTDVVLLNTTPQGKSKSLDRKAPKLDLETPLKLDREALESIAKSITIEDKTKKGERHLSGRHPTTDELIAVLNGETTSRAIPLRVHTDRTIQLDKNVQKTFSIPKDTIQSSFTIPMGPIEDNSYNISVTTR